MVFKIISKRVKICIFSFFNYESYYCTEAINLMVIGNKEILSVLKENNTNGVTVFKLKSCSPFRTVNILEIFNFSIFCNSVATNRKNKE